jgi:hypothetical protein
MRSTRSHSNAAMRMQALFDSVKSLKRYNVEAASSRVIVPLQRFNLLTL